jgi:hypothetical protein
MGCCRPWCFLLRKIELGVADGAKHLKKAKPRLGGWYVAKQSQKSKPELGIASSLPSCGAAVLRPYKILLTLNLGEFAAFQCC